MKKQFSVLPALFFAVALAGGCSHSTSSSGSTGTGPGTNPPGNPPASTATKLALGLRAGPSAEATGSIGVHKNTQIAASTLPGPLRFLAAFVDLPDATTTDTNSISMSFSGFCNSLPDWSNSTNQTGEFMIYGLGTLSQSGNGCGINSGDYNLPTAGQNYVGSPVVGSGVISELHVYLAIPIDQDITVKIYRNMNPTTLTCKIAAGARSCADSSDYDGNAQDGDTIVATGQLGPVPPGPPVMGHAGVGLRILLGKS